MSKRRTPRIPMILESLAERSSEGLVETSQATEQAPPLLETLNKIKVSGVLLDNIGLGEALFVLFNLTKRSSYDASGTSRDNEPLGDFLLGFLELNCRISVSEGSVGFDGQRYVVGPKEGVPLVYNGPVVKLLDRRSINRFKAPVFESSQASEAVGRSSGGL